MKAETLTVVDSTMNIRLTDDPLEPLLDSENATAWLSHPDAGALLWFHGVTRRTTILKDQVNVTKELAYTAHREMAVKELQRIASEAIEEYSLHRIVLWHRLGIVPISEASVIVGCSSSHRVAALQAVASVMDHLKRDVPIWKQERFESGDRQWIHLSPTTDDPH